MLPKDIIDSVWTETATAISTSRPAAPDAILTAAKFIQHLGFKKGEPWIQEVTIPENLPFEKSASAAPWTAPTGSHWVLHLATATRHSPPCPSSLVLPQGRKGPAFITYPISTSIWNGTSRSSTRRPRPPISPPPRLSGAPPYQKGNPEPGLSLDEMKGLQTKLQALGYDVGKIDAFWVREPGSPSRRNSSASACPPTAGRHALLNAPLISHSRRMYIPAGLFAPVFLFERGLSTKNGTLKNATETSPVCAVKAPQASL